MVSDESNAVRLLRMEKQLRKDIGSRLVRVRKERSKKVSRQLSQEQFAEQLGIHVNTLARYERGERLPRAGVLFSLGQQGIDLHWLLTGRRLLDGVE